MKVKLLTLLAVLALASCVRVKPWERELLAMEPMQPEGHKLQCFEHNAEVYREGAIGGQGGKSGRAQQKMIRNRPGVLRFDALKLFGLVDKW